MEAVNQNGAVLCQKRKRGDPKRKKLMSFLMRFQVLKLLRSKSKYHEPKKDSLNEDFQSWNYSIRGKSVDAEDIRIILSFDENIMLIITVINLSE